jgi:hypothetical protein
MDPTAATMPRRTRSRKKQASGDRFPRQPQNARRNYERYLELARAAAVSGDLIAAENYLQHAEHYLRSMGEQRPSDGSGPGPQSGSKQRLKHNG